MREDSYAVRPHLIILGGGHVAQPLCRLARVMQYRITVMDDREEFASPKWFPDADEIICADFSELHKRIPSPAGIRRISSVWSRFFREAPLMSE